MPSLLSRNPFHNSGSNSDNHHYGSNTHSSSMNPQKHGVNQNSNEKIMSNNSSESSPPPLIKSSKSFLNFIHRGQSNDSIRSEKSTDSLNASGTHSHHHGSAHQNSAAIHNPGLHDSLSPASPKPSHSMAELKRFFRPSLPKRKSSNLASQSMKPSSSTISMSPYSKPNRKESGQTQSAIPPSSDSTLSLSNKLNIYHDDSILAQKYGKLGKLLGSGAGGSVKILARPSDGATFAVKEFRPRKPSESVKEYAKKCTAEFLIGSTLTHPNVIETLDIFSDSKQNKYYEVMEYCPIDFFAVVMTGKMTRGEINCCTKQISRGVQYLHAKGLAHRDLKLDNCVMTAKGIVKLIDFGSAVVFKYPFENQIEMAHGVVGSDPYLAPEVITSPKSYDPQFVDVWSIAIIFCCLMLKRFPWKAPREDTDDNFKLFCMPDDTEHDYVESAKHNELVIKERLRKKHEKEAYLLKGVEEIKLKIIEKAINNDKIQNNEKCSANEQNIQEERDKTSKKILEEKNKSKKLTKDTYVSQELPASFSHGKQEGEFSAASSKKDEQISTNGTSQDPKHVPAAGQRSKHHKMVIHGPYRLLRLLPHSSRPILSRMLSVDPSKRATVNEVFEDEWFKDIPCCTMDAQKNVIHAPGHHHTMVDEENAHLESYKP